jgi:signal transduction histidine kinase
MTLCSVSTDRRFHAICAEALSDMPGIEHRSAASASGAPSADIYIRDFDPGEPVFDSSAEAETVYVARPEDLGALHGQAKGKALAALAKPVDAPGLRQFLEAAVSRRNDQARKADPRRPERDQFLECVLLAGLKLQQFRAEQSNFLSRALHDLWAPLTAADGYCAMLLQDGTGDLSPEQAGTLRRLHFSLRRLLRTTSLIYQLGSGGSDRELPAIAHAGMETCVNNAVRSVLPFARSRDIEVRTKVIEPPQPMYFDAAQIEMVLDNLLENACRCTPKAASVELEAFPVVWNVRRFRLQGADGVWFQPIPASGGPNAYRVDVRDGGPAVSASDLAGMFDQHSPNYSGNGRSGAGLALAACRWIISGHCGEVTVEPQAKGAVISFVLPFVEPELMHQSINLQEQPTERSASI